MNSNALKNIDGNAIVREASRNRLINFARYLNPDFVLKDFHKVYYRLLDMFAHGLIRKMMVEAPPQHGKSEGSSRLTPSFMLGLNPDLKICIGSYAAAFAQDFNRDVQKIIDRPEYRQLFPETYLSGANVVTMANNYLRNSTVIETVGHRGYLRVVGRGGALTGKSVDVMILDDVYKDYKEANSPVVRDAAWKWYTTVVKTRLHNDSQELIVFTRWHQDDIIGKIEQSGTEQIVEFTKWSDAYNIPDGAWLRVNFEALKTGEPSEIDPRRPGDALWPEKHSKEKLEAAKALDPVQFQCLYQGNPGSAAGRLYQPFKTYVDKETYGEFVRRGNYTDVADEGTDALCSICYDIYKGEQDYYNEYTGRFETMLYALITDIEYTDAGTETTTVTVPAMMNRNGTEKAYIESNNGGSGFAKTIDHKVRAIIDAFYQSANKESRIITNSSNVNACIVFPFGWEDRFPAAYKHITEFLRNFKANEHDDIEDVLTGIYEKEIADGNTEPYNAVRRGVIRRN